MLPGPQLLQHRVVQRDHQAAGSDGVISAVRKRGAVDPESHKMTERRSIVHISLDRKRDGRTAPHCPCQLSAFHFCINRRGRRVFFPLRKDDYIGLYGLPEIKGRREGSIGIPAVEGESVPYRIRRPDSRLSVFDRLGSDLRAPVREESDHMCRCFFFFFCYIGKPR